MWRQFLLKYLVFALLIVILAGVCLTFFDWYVQYQIKQGQTPTGWPKVVTSLFSGDSHQVIKDWFFGLTVAVLVAGGLFCLLKINKFRAIICRKKLYSASAEKLCCLLLSENFVVDTREFGVEIKDGLMMVSVDVLTYCQSEKLARLVAFVSFAGWSKIKETVAEADTDKSPYLSLAKALVSTWSDKEIDAFIVGLGQESHLLGDHFHEVVNHCCVEKAAGEFTKQLELMLERLEKLRQTENGKKELVWQKNFNRLKAVKVRRSWFGLLPVDWRGLFQTTR